MRMMSRCWEAGCVAIVMFLSVSGVAFSDRPGLLKVSILRAALAIPAVHACSVVSRRITRPVRFPVFFTFRRVRMGNIRWMPKTVIGITDLTASADKNWIVFLHQRQNGLCCPEKRLAGHFPKPRFRFCPCPAGADYGEVRPYSDRVVHMA